jgi:toxin-antitoxin system PIN domain toxin
VTLIDANLLLYAANRKAQEHERAAEWLQSVLNGDGRVGLPWESLTAFVRVATNPRVAPRVMSSAAAWAIVESWLAAPAAWIPLPTDRHAQVFGALLGKYRLTGKLVPDAHLVALAIQHGLDVYSADSDFARFKEIRWINPLDG